MIVIRTRHFPFGNYTTINLFGILFTKNKKLSKRTINHERIHTKQMKEMLFIFYLWYGIANKGSSNSDIKSLFIFENKANNKTITRTSSFGSWNNVDIPDEGINWQTKNKYNNADIVSGIEQDGSDIFTIGGYNSTNAGNWYGYHDDIILLNRSLTVDEINDITKAVFKEDILKPTFDLKATDVIDVVNDRGGELTEYTDIYGVNYTFNDFTLGDAV